MRFKDQVALITAAANGIGRATAEIMAREGAIVVAVDNHPERLESAVGALSQAGGRAHGRLCDALDQGQVDDVVAGVAREFGQIDILVNAVGGSTTSPSPPPASRSTRSTTGSASSHSTCAARSCSPMRWCR
jgi:NAD(P)-dependent dehydrogenase (short-subunit alcohol dehydrogenase family)